MEIPTRSNESAFIPTPPAQEAVAIGLNATILSMQADEPVVAVVPAPRAEHTDEGSLPSGPFSPREHVSLEAGVRHWVKRYTGIDLGLVRQLCTLGGHSGTAGKIAAVEASPAVSISYLALVRPARVKEAGSAAWRSWYAYFPWEDWRQGKPALLTREIEPRLHDWAGRTPPGRRIDVSRDALDRRQRLRFCFGLDGAAWDDERVLERYELLTEAGLIGSADDDHDEPAQWRLPHLSHPLLGDHGRVLATAIGEVRRSIKYQPIVFELMPEAFTLLELQKTVEAMLGPHLHKQNFRRLVEGMGLVEQTGDQRFRTGGRPARLYRFRRDVLLERPAPGVRVKAGRA